jgi:ATP-dependent RNA helicase RhlB
MRFADLDLPGAVRQGIESAGFTECTEIQAQALPPALAGSDVAGQSQTGTGKTAAFLIALFTRLVREPAPPTAEVASPRALIVAPTRELAVQIHQDALLLGQFTGLRLHLVFGGVDYEKQRQAFQARPDILIGTPGRLIDYLKQGVYALRHVEVLVVDEADRMFDMGFIDDLRYLLRRLPPPQKRQSFLFSATLSWDVVELAFEHMHEPVRVAATPEQITAEKVEHLLYHVGIKEKFSLLLGILQQEKPERALVFANTKREVERLAERLTANGYRAEAITGDVDQRKRLRIMRDFKAGLLPMLVATDVASRGLHIEGVTHVINYDLPQDPEDYVHRIGRTARAGASGRAVSLACEDHVLNLEAIERLIGFKLPVHWAEDYLFLPEVRVPRPYRRREEGGHRGLAGRREERGHRPGRPADAHRRRPDRAHPAGSDARPPMAGHGEPGPAPARPSGAGQAGARRPDSDAGRKRRRRRRGGHGARPGGGGGTPPPGPPAV